MTLDIFARVRISLVFSETSWTIKIKINHFINQFMAICWITNTITLYNIPAHFIALYLYTHDRFRKGDILTSVAFHAVSQIYECLNSLMFWQLIRYNLCNGYRKLPGISLMRVGNTAFLPQGYGVLRNRGHNIFTLARRFRATNLSI